MILITGGFGLIGTLLRAKSEVYKDADIYDIANNPEQDILDYGKLYRTLNGKKYDAVIHLAEIPFTETESIGESRKNYRVNLDAMQNLNRLTRLSETRLVYCLKTNQTAISEHIDFITQRRHTTLVPAVYVELPDILPTIDSAGEVTGNSVISNVLRAARSGETFKLNMQGGDILELAREEDVVQAFEKAISPDTTGKVTIKANTVYSLSVAQLIALLKEGYPTANIEYTGEIVTTEELSQDIRQFFSDIVPVRPTPLGEGGVLGEETTVGSENPNTP